MAAPARRAPGTKVELADIVRRHGAAFRAAHRLCGVQHQALRAIERCRTAALGGELRACDACGARRYVYHSCRNRHCPKCQTRAKERWLADRRAELLPVPYYHLVFTLPAAIADIAYYNKAVIYDIPFKAAAETLITIAADPKHLGARVGLRSAAHLGLGAHASPARAPHRAGRPRLTATAGNKR